MPQSIHLFKFKWFIIIPQPKHPKHQEHCDDEKQNKQERRMRQYLTDWWNVDDVADDDEDKKMVIHELV